MEEIFKLISDVGLPIAGALVMGFFLFIIIRQIFEGIIDNIATLTMFAESLENRARTMSNEMVKIDLLVSSALGLNPDIDRVARAENFVEDGKVDVRRD
jgi:K+-transporting ATPase c subunit